MLIRGYIAELPPKEGAKNCGNAIVPFLTEKIKLLAIKSKSTNDPNEILQKKSKISIVNNLKTKKMDAPTIRRSEGSQTITEFLLGRWKILRSCGLM